MSFKKELKALEILEKPEASLTEDFYVNHPHYSFKMVQPKRKEHCTKGTTGDYSLYLSPGRGGTEDFWGHMVFRGIEGKISRRQ